MPETSENRSTYPESPCAGVCSCSWSPRSASETSIVSPNEDGPAAPFPGMGAGSGVPISRRMEPVVGAVELAASTSEAAAGTAAGAAAGAAAEALTTMR